MWPLPVRDPGDGIVHYRATVRPNSETEYKNLNNNVFIGTFKRARGALAFKAIIDAGTGAQTLTVPIKSGEAQGFSRAYLLSCECRHHGADGNVYECDIDVAILNEDITP